MRKLLRWLVAVLLVIAGAAFAASFVVSRPLFDDRLAPERLDGIAIAPPEQALTFARTAVDSRVLLLVTAYRGGKVEAVDLNARLGTTEGDPIRLYRELGYDALMRQAVRAENNVTVDAAALVVPFDAQRQNIGVGLNYREHARESSLDEEPFLFPKFATPSHWQSAVEKKDSRLLDYEAEIGLVALQDIAEPASPALGLVLANEVTDRWALVRNLDRKAPLGTTGFGDGKSREGFAPVGALLVIPRDVESFLRGLELELYVNGRLRQRARASEMVWGAGAIVAEVLKQKDTPYRYAGGDVRLLGDKDRISPATIVFSGTPAGVIFKPLNLWNPWVYLKPGDEIVIRSEMLGVIRNRVVD